VNKKAFLKGYHSLDKEGAVGALIQGVAKGAPGMVANMTPAMAIDVIGGKWQDENIKEYRARLGLPPEELPDVEDNNTQKKLQDNATSGSVSITT
jgi:hypothetical protein